VQADYPCSGAARVARPPARRHFPLLEGEAFDQLVADVREHGVQEPIVLYQERILDGRNRYRAAQAAGVECPTRHYDGDDPIAFVVSANIHRRHLDASQRAMIAARLANMRQGERTDLPSFEGRLSQEQAADLLNVGVASVERAKTVLDSGDSELIKAVEHGDFSVSGAAEQVRRGIVTGVAMHPYAERGFDLYETPAPAVRALLEVEQFEGPIWEPACGPGAIVRVLRDTGHKVVATDIKDYGCPDSTGGADFLAQTSAPAGVTTIITNQPFMHANKFARHALTLAPRVVMLLRLAFLEGQGRSDILDGGQLARVHVFRNRLPMMHRNTWEGAEASSYMAFAWFCWDREHHGPIELHRISWEPDDGGEALTVDSETPDAPESLQRAAE
jgi:hypothetical protein